MSNAETLIHVFMTSRLNYCNDLLGACSARSNSSWSKMQQLEFLLEPGSMTILARFLHWLPIKHRIDFKILLITYKALNWLAPQYLSELLSHCSPPHPLHSENSGNLIIPRISTSTAGGRSFSYSAPNLWNNLPNIVRW